MQNRIRVCTAAAPRDHRMSLAIARRSWVLAERLFIHAYDTDAFLRLLHQHNIEYHGDPYRAFGTTKGLYTFMSEENYEFPRFMEFVPSYKYLPVLEDIVFDPKVTKTTEDNWNYYGEFIKNWYTDLVDLLNLAGIEVNDDRKKLVLPKPPPEPDREDYFPDEFGDSFIDYIRKEANECKQHDLNLSLMFLARKIFEVVTVRLFEVVFPKLVNGKYSKENHELWYNRERSRYHSFDQLLDNLKEHSRDFQEDAALIREFVALVKPVKNEINKHVHLDYKVPDERYLNEWRIPRLVAMARKLYRKYCNP